jgi:hypothetical protein
VYFQIYNVCGKLVEIVETQTTEIQASVAVKGEIKILNMRKDRGIRKIERCLNSALKINSNLLYGVA